MDKYFELLQAMINALSSLMGPSLVAKRTREAGLDIDADDKTLIRYTGNGEEAVKNLLNQFKALSGNMAVDYIVERLNDNLFTKYPELKDFLLNQKT